MAGPVVPPSLHSTFAIAVLVLVPLRIGAAPLTDDTPMGIPTIPTSTSPAEGAEERGRGSATFRPSGDLPATGTPDPGPTKPVETEMATTTLEPESAEPATPISPTTAAPGPQDQDPGREHTADGQAVPGEGQDAVQDPQILEQKQRREDDQEQGQGSLVVSETMHGTKSGRQIGYRSLLRQRGTCDDNGLQQRKDEMDIMDDEIQKHIYIHLPASEPPPVIASTAASKPRRRKHYKIVFIKPPTAPPPLPSPSPPTEVDEERTFIYVLVPAVPSPSPPTTPSSAAARIPSSHEVYFIRYKAPPNDAPPEKARVHMDETLDVASEPIHDNEVLVDGDLTVPSLPVTKDKIIIKRTVSSQLTADKRDDSNAGRTQDLPISAPDKDDDVMSNSLLPDEDLEADSSADILRGSSGSIAMSTKRESPQHTAPCQEFHRATDVNDELYGGGAVVGGGLDLEALRQRRPHLGVLCSGPGTGTPFSPALSTASTMDYRAGTVRSPRRFSARYSGFKELRS